LASVATSLYNIGGIAGCFLIAYFCDRTAPQRTLCVTFLASAVSVLFIARAGNAPVALIATTVVAGFCTIGGQIAMNAFTSAYYPPAARASGLGWALAVGRFGSILGPLIAGFLIGMNVSGPNLFRLSAIPAALTAVAIILVRRSPELPDGPAQDALIKTASLSEF
jgi:AAHS family 4-hydroxybenzoate transporter-like MFS transporter